MTNAQAENRTIDALEALREDLNRQADAIANEHLAPWTFEHAGTLHSFAIDLTKITKRLLDQSHTTLGTDAGRKAITKGDSR